jgi:hypothetical protein
MENGFGLRVVIMHKTEQLFGEDVAFIEYEIFEEYLSEEFVEEAVDSDEMTPDEAWFLSGWREAMRET